MNENIILHTMCGCSRPYKIKLGEKKVTLNLSLYLDNKFYTIQRTFKNENGDTNKQGLRIFREIIMVN